MTSTASAPFVGARHRAAVERIVDAIARPGDAGPRIFVLEGESGVGKTRIAREVYERLASRTNDSSRYWPQLPEALPAGLAQEPTAGRKLMGPEVTAFAHAPNVPPGFGWWALQCEASQHSAFRYLETIDAQLGTHSDQLRLAVERHRDWRAHAKALARGVGDDARAVTADEIESMIVGLVPVPFASAGVGLARRIAARGLEDLRRRRAFRAGTEAGEAEAARNVGRVERVAQRLTSLASPQVPGVLAIEDLQHMTPEMDAFLRALPRAASHPFTIIATMTSGARNPRCLDWLRESGAEIVEVAAPSAAELAELLAHGPLNAMREGELVDLARTLRIPLAVQLFLGLDDVQDAAHRLDVEPAAAVAALQRTATSSSALEQLYMRHWGGLDVDTRRAITLGVATSSVPTAAESGSRASYEPESVAAAAATLGLDRTRGADGLQGAFDHAIASRWASRHLAHDTVMDAWITTVAIRSAADLGLREDAVERLRGETERIANARAAASDRLDERIDRVRTLRDRGDLAELADVVGGTSVVLDAATRAVDDGDPDQAIALLGAATGSDATVDDDYVEALLALASLRLLDDHPSDLVQLGLRIGALVGAGVVSERWRTEADAIAATAATIAEVARLLHDGPKQNVSMSPQHAAVIEAVRESRLRIRAAIGAWSHAESRLVRTTAMLLTAANARGSAEALLRSVRRALLADGRPLGDVMTVEVTALLLDLVGGSGSSTEMVPIARSQYEAALARHGSGDEMTIGALTSLARWLHRSDADGKREARTLSTLAALLADEHHGPGSWPSLLAHSIRFGCRQSDRSLDAAVFDRELQRVCDVASAAVGGDPGRARFIAWMRRNRAHVDSVTPPADAHEGRVVLRPIASPATSAEDTGDLRLRYPGIGDVPGLTTTGRRRPQPGQRLTAVQQHLADHGIDLESL